MCSSLAVSLKNVLEKVKIINFIKSQPLSAHVFDILYEELSYIHMKLFTTYTSLITKRHLCDCLNDGLKYRFLRVSPSLLERTIDKLWLFRYLADISSKENKVSLPFQGKQLIIFTANDKI